MRTLKEFIYEKMNRNDLIVELSYLDDIVPEIKKYAKDLKLGTEYWTIFDKSASVFTIDIIGDIVRSFGAYKIKPIDNRRFKIISTNPNVAIAIVALAYQNDYELNDSNSQKDIVELYRKITSHSKIHIRKLQKHEDSTDSILEKIKVDDIILVEEKFPINGTAEEMVDWLRYNKFVEDNLKYNKITNQVINYNLQKRKMFSIKSSSGRTYITLANTTKNHIWDNNPMIVIIISKNYIKYKLILSSLGDSELISAEDCLAWIEKIMNK